MYTDFTEKRPGCAERIGTYNFIANSVKTQAEDIGT